MLTYSLDDGYRPGADEESVLKVLEDYSSLGGDTVFELRLGQTATLSCQNSSLLKEPLSFDVLSDRLMWRLEHSGRHSEAVARAVLSDKECLKVFDATAGLGRDAMVLQSAGADVAMFERNPVIWLLLNNALRRAEQDYGKLSRLKHGLPMLMPYGTLKDYLSVRVKDLPDVIYYDPMFPSRRKTALVKKEMQVFHVLAGPDEDSTEYLDFLLSLKVKRVVLKRPAGADPLAAGRQPDFSVDGKACRYDCYLTRR